MGAKTTLTNEATGAVILSHHAWIRFLTRFLKFNIKEAPKSHKPGKLIDKLATIFAEARLTKLPRKTEARRLDNNGSRVVYLYNRKHNLRFIVTENSPRILLTVEVADLTRKSQSLLPGWYRHYLKQRRKRQNNLRWL